MSDNELLIEGRGGEGRGGEGSSDGPGGSKAQAKRRNKE